MQDFETALHDEYSRLVKLCAYLTGDADEADDLAQETLVEAWRNRHKLLDVSGMHAWLSAIARNVYLRWRSRQGRQRALQGRVEQAGEETVDFELDLERHELQSLLHEALTLLPEATREVLVARFIESLSPAEIASRLGISQNNVTLRLHRGRGALADILRDGYASELEPQNDVWQTTSLWCAICGKHKLEGKLNSLVGRLLLRCPHCLEKRGNYFNATDELPEVLRGIKGYKTGFSRISKWAAGYYLPGLRAGVADCSNCGQPVYPIIWRDDDDYRIDSSCLRCGCNNYTSLSGSAFSLPEAQRFWRDHPHVHLLPLTHIGEVDGEPAITVTYAALDSTQRFEAVFGLNSYHFLRVKEA